MRPLFILSFLAMMTPTLAQTPPVPAPAPTAAAIAPTPPAALLDSLIGKPQIIGITETSGTRFLGHVISGDHGMYVVQAFHFAGPPKITTQKEAAAPPRQKAHTKTYTVGSGRNRQRIRVVTYSTVPGKKARKTRVQTDTTIPDDEAVRLLLRGAAGSNTKPREIAGTRTLLALTDVKYLQVLAPPSQKGAAVPFPNDAFLASPTTTPQHSWTMTTLWPMDGKLDTKPGHGRKKRGHRKPKFALPAASPAPTPGAPAALPPPAPNASATPSVVF